MNVRGADLVMYQVTDLDRSIAFYRDTLGLDFESRYKDYWAEFSVPPTTLALAAMQNRPWATGEGGDDVFRPGGATIFLAVESVEETVRELAEKGVEVSQPGGESPVCHFAAIKDPDGNTIHLHQRKDGSCG